jgi:hypothetical protein
MASERQAREIYAIGRKDAQPDIEPAMLNVLFVRLRVSARSQAARYGFERSLMCGFVLRLAGALLRCPLLV